MKQFLKMTLAVILGIILSVFVLTIMLGSFASALVALDSSSPVPSKAVLDLDMSRLTVTEQSIPTNPFESVTTGGETVASVGLWDAVSAIRRAAVDERISYILLRTDGLMTEQSIAEELRAALAEFRTSGKAVLAYIENPTSLSYYLASVADKVYMTSHPGSMVMINGVSSNMFYLKDLLDKLGVRVQLIRHGKYKSAGEPYIRSRASAEALEQSQAMVSSMWNSMAEKIAQSRGIGVDQLNSMVDNLVLVGPEQMLESGLVDGLFTAAQLRSKIADIAVESSFDKVKFVGLSDYVADLQLTPAKHPAGEIAVVYADGQIVDGNTTQQVAGARYSEIIRKLAEDDSVKAIVLRVNSPGGSVLASEKIKSELDSIVGKKPLIASYGAYAASGGYWISNNCDKIYSDALTLTGSIGVFSMIPDFGKVVKDKAYINIETVSSNRHGDMLSMMRPFDNEEYRYMQAPVEQIYERFVSVVSEGRDLSAARVDEIGQGRVWTGADALGIGLVDEIGGLQDALGYAALAAGDPDLDQWNVVAYPKPQTLLESLMRMFGQESDLNAMMLEELKTMKKTKLVARIPYKIELCFQ